MEYKDWQIIKVIAEEKSITKAAERLYIAQPSLTYRFKNIEKELGSTLLLRTQNGVLLTPQGEYFLAYAKEMLQRFHQVKEYIQNMDNTVRGTLRLGSSAVIAHYMLPTILKNFMDLYPNVEISLKTGMSQKINRMLHKDEVSVAIIRGEVSWSEEKHLLRNEPVCLVSRQPLRLDELPHKPRIAAQTDGPLQAMFEEWWRQNFKTPPNVTMELDSMETCRQMVSHGLGWAILPAIGIAENDNLHIQPLYWQDGRPLQRPTWLLCHHSSLELSAVQAFISYLKERVEL